MKQEWHREEKNALEAVGIPLIQLPASILSSPGKYLPLDDNEFHLSMCCFMSS